MISHTIAFFVVKKGVLISALFMSISFLIYLYKFTKNQKLKDKSDLKFNRWCFIFLIIFAFFMLMFDTVLSRRAFVEEPHKLKQITIVVPETYAESSGRVVFKYLKVDNKHSPFHCLEDFHDACMKIYQYHGKTATIYYQSNTKVKNLVYEIVVDGQRIYQFEQQLSAFKAQRKAENIEILWLLFLYLLPAIYFMKLYGRFIIQIPEMTDEEKKEYEIRNKESIQLKRDLFRYRIDYIEFHQLSNALKRYYIIVKLFIFMAMITFFAIGMYLGVFLLSSMLTARWLIAMILLCLVTPSFYIVIKCLQALTQKKSI